MIELPRALVEAVERELSSVDPRTLRRLASDLSQRYRGARTPGQRLAAGADDALAYAALLLPATWAQVVGALLMVPKRAGQWRPRRVLDLGAGPGTAAWSIAHVWPEIESVVAVERDAAFVGLGRRLSAASAIPAVRATSWVARDLRRALPEGPFDLVVLGHVAGELDDAEARSLLARAWEACEGVLLVVEPGTPAGFEVVKSARELLLAAGARTLAPCAHDEPCPLKDDWCHFAQRVGRPAFQRRVKDASLPWEDAKFSFAALSRFEPVDRPWARVIHEPRNPKHRVELTASAREGILQLVVPKRRPEAHRLAKALTWGSAIERREDVEPDDSV